MSNRSITPYRGHVVPKEPVKQLTTCSNCGHIEVTDSRKLAQSNPYERWIGRIVIFELSTGSRIQGKILQCNDTWIDTDNGAVKIESIVQARWVGEEEARIIRGGPLRPR